MNILRDRRRSSSVILWVPVGAIVAALFLVPSGTDAAAPEHRRVGTLNVTPKNVYSPGHTTGGQIVTFSGDLGGGIQTVRLERAGSRDSASWGAVHDPSTGQDFTTVTNPDGSFSFDFPAPGMRNCWFRVVSGTDRTEPHQFESVFQDVEIRSNATVNGHTTVDVGQPFSLTGDTILREQDARPLFPGRAAALQERDSTGDWVTVDTGSVGVDGKIGFSPITVLDPGERVYRIRLADFQQGGDFIGWYPSLPFFVTVAQ